MEKVSTISSNKITNNSGKTVYDSKNTSSKFTCYLCFVAVFGALGGFSFGYDTGVVSGALLFIRTEFELDSFDQEVLVSVTIATAMITAFMSGYLGDKIGRRPSMLIGSFVFTVSTILNGVSKTYWMLLLGRGLLGIGIGVILMISPVYIAECSPVKYRGPLVTLCTGMMAIGRTVASIVDGAFSYDKTGWRYMLGLTGVPSLVQFIGFLFLPETPRYLVRNGKEDMATHILQRIRGRSDVSDDIKQIKEICQQEIKLKELQGNEWTLKKIMLTPSVRRALIVGVSTSLIQQLSGINTVMYYSGTIIQMSGVRDEIMAIWLTAVTAGVSCIFTLSGIYLVEKVGRRKLILSSLAGVLLSLIVLAVAFQLSEINSPEVTYSEDVNNTCSSYSSCATCIKEQNCGFCYIEDGYSAINGSCAHKLDTMTAKYGRCNSTELSNGLIWGATSCPSQYFWMCLLGLSLYLITFSPGIGPLPMTINSEIYPLWARSTCMAIASSANWLFSLVISLSFLTLTDSVGAYGTYWLFAAVVVLGFIFLFFTLPETKDKKLEDVESLFETPWCSYGKSGSLEINKTTNKPV
ncbi:proton myo-inositol cotransporter-like [Mytilus galloprovincialis]|uniref:proton myo-inositol cotransporter-like n=1 Tax=Mytilus galloprovincialis TaxID=29158 RepID=UPI003F7C867C